MALFKKRVLVSSQMTVAQLLSLTPLARDILKGHGIVFIGKSLSPLESLDVVGKGNGLSLEQIQGIVRELEEALTKKPVRSGPLLILSPPAEAECKRLLDEKKKNGFRLRLASDGCGLYTYDLDFADKKHAGETATMVSGMHFYIETKHIPLLQGTELDFANGFIFKNPNLRKE